jgi:acetyl esterase/lipase
MTSFFLFLALVSAFSTYNIYQPLLKQKHGAMFSFLNGWLVGELALHAIVVQVTGTLLFIWAGAVTGWMGMAGMALSIASWAGLTYYTLQAGFTSRLFEEALKEGLGHDYEQSIDPEFKSAFDSPLSRERLILPHKGLSSPHVETIKNITYTEADGLRLKLDVRRKRDFQADSPVLLQIHGGAWTYRMGSKNEQALPLMNHLAMLGWVCVSIDYRLSPLATFPDHIIDCKKALCWVKEHIESYGGDPGFVVVTGGSAGGHLSALMAVSENLPAFQPGFEEKDTRVQGCVSFYGIYDFLDENSWQTHKGLHQLLEKSVMKVSKKDNPALYRLASPITHIHQGVCPFLLIQGDKDSLVSCNESRWFAEKLRHVSKNPVVYTELPGAQHAFDLFPSLRSELTLQGIDRFLAWLYSRHLDRQ